MASQSQRAAEIKSIKFSLYLDVTLFKFELNKFDKGAIQIVAYISNGRVIAKLCWVVRVEAIFDQNRLLHSIAHFQRSGSQ